MKIDYGRLRNLMCAHFRLVTLFVLFLAVLLALRETDIMSLKALFAGGTVYRNIVWYGKGMKEFTRYI